MLASFVDMSEEKVFRVDLNREEGFEFMVNFNLDGVEPIIMDEPAPVGGGAGPNASKILAAAMGNCLAASLLFCLQKSRVDVGALDASVNGVIARNPEGRWRVKEIAVELSPEVSEEDQKKLDRCAEIFENFCIISQSVSQGIPIRVQVKT